MIYLNLSIKQFKKETVLFKRADGGYTIIRPMHTEEEKNGFSQRLRTALKLAGLDQVSNANLANRFNLRHPNQPISTQAFHHWLSGRSIPTADKVETLAKWLNTSSEWLRHGRVAHDCGTLSESERLMLQYFRALTPAARQAVIALLHEFHLPPSDKQAT